MPKFWLGVLCDILISSLVVVPGMTQQQAEQIEIGGVHFQIGMAKDTALSRITNGGLDPEEAVAKSGNSEEVETIAVIQKNDLLGLLGFTNSRLSLATRRWDSDDTGAAQLARKFCYLLNSFEKQGSTSSTIKNYEGESVRETNGSAGFIS
jgi:hypothetical protein